MSATNTFETIILDAILVSGNSYTAGNVYAALYSSAPSEAGSGTEITGNNYSRQQVTFTVANSVATSSAAITFSATGNTWPAAVALAITDAASAGNILFYTSLNPTQTVTAGANVVFTAGNITVTAD